MCFPWFLPYAFYNWPKFCLDYWMKVSRVLKMSALAAQAVVVMLIWMRVESQHFLPHLRRKRTMLKVLKKVNIHLLFDEKGFEYIN